MQSQPQVVKKSTVTGKVWSRVKEWRRRRAGKVGEEGGAETSLTAHKSSGEHDSPLRPDTSSGESLTPHIPASLSIPPRSRLPQRTLQTREREDTHVGRERREIRKRVRLGEIKKLRALHVRTLSRFKSSPPTLFTLIHEKTSIFSAITERHRKRHFDSPADFASPTSGR